MVQVKERFIFFISLIALSFIATNFDSNLGIVFSVFLLGTFFLFVTDNKPQILIESKPNKLKSIGLGIGAYIVLILIGGIFVPLIGGLLGATDTASVTNPNSVFDVLVETQQTFALEGSIFLNILAFGILVPIIETWLFFGTGFEALADFFKINPLNVSGAIIFVTVVLASLFTIFHFTSKGIDNDAGLILVFLFAVISIILVLIEKQLLSAIVFHVVANTTAISIKLGVASDILIGGFISLGIIGGLFFLLNKFKVRNISFA